ncbi:hypothetical protein QQF64_025561 [Cirrhinus molitorella]|uniref:BED-type domain-containing protein n=1 Tax=Cirrhinus molitorella TaxID=172907 RepID=A0ABR3NQF6_9TELE
MEASTTASSFSEEGSQQQKASFDGWRFSHYFEYVQQKENNLTVKCTLCPGRKLLSTACNSTSNLKKHLERQHRHIKLVAKRRSDKNQQPPKQQKLSFEHKIQKVEDICKIQLVVPKTLTQLTIQISTRGPQANIMDV